MIRIFHHFIIAVAIVAAIVTTACSANNSETKSCDMAVTIQPLKYIIEAITGGDFTIEVIVPKGASPETYEPTPKQIIGLDNTKLIFSTGLIDFENALLDRIRNKKSIINLSKGIDLIEGSCSHNHSAGESGTNSAAHDHNKVGHHHNSHHHSHGIDPHIWTSPRELKIMARNAFDAIAKHYPDSAKYDVAYNALIEELDTLDRECEQICRNSDIKAFVVYHPALTYYARAYGIEQIAVENEGKEPSAKHLAHIIEQAKDKNVQCVLYQMQYPRSVVEVVAKDMGVECREFDPLAENISENILLITRTITGENPLK